MVTKHNEMTYLDYSFKGSKERLVFDEELSATNFFKQWDLDEGQVCMLHRTEDDQLVIVYSDFVEEYASVDDDSFHENQLDLF